VAALEARANAQGTVNVAECVDGSRLGRADADGTATTADAEAEGACARLEELTEVLVSNHTTCIGGEDTKDVEAADLAGSGSDGDGPVEAGDLWEDSTEDGYWEGAAAEEAELARHWVEEAHWRGEEEAWLDAGDADGVARGGAESGAAGGGCGEEPQDGVAVHRQFSALVANPQQERLHAAVLRRMRTGREVEPRVETLASRIALRCGTALKPDWHSEFLSSAFPLLFPFGTGWHTARHVRVSLKRYLSHLLRMDSSKAGDHPLFVLAAYGIVARQEVSKAAYLRATSDAPSRGVQLRGITPSVFEDVAAHLELQDQCRRMHLPRPQVSAEVAAAGTQHAPGVATVTSTACGRWLNVRPSLRSSPDAQGGARLFLGLAHGRRSGKLPSEAGCTVKPLRVAHSVPDVCTR